MALQLGIFGPAAGASFPSPLPSGVALNIKLFNLIQFAMTNTSIGYRCGQLLEAKAGVGQGQWF